MGLLQAAYRTYEAFADKAGIPEENKEALAPVSHMIQNAAIEITIDLNGNFVSAAPVAKEDRKTIIPVTIESASRTSNPEAHPLADQLGYLAPHDEKKFVSYMKALTQWTESDFSHPKAEAVLAYAQGRTIVGDLLAAGVIQVNEKGSIAKHEKSLVRFRVIPSPDGVQDACWQDQTLFDAFAGYYAHQCAQKERDICLITGEEDILCETHPKGVLPISSSAKLLSAKVNDNTDFTFRGRFTEAREAYSVGYTASQKAHNALRWVAANEGTILGGRTFLCWNPDGKPVPSDSLFGFSSEETVDFVGYQKELRATLGGYRNELDDVDDVIVTALDAATTGRLSVTYYNELKASDFLSRIEHWYTTCCWNTRFWGTQSPALRRIAECACGVQRGNFIEADERVLRDYIQRLMHCILSSQRIPEDIVAALVNKSGNLLPYTPTNREILLTTTCALVRKYKNQKNPKEAWTLALDINNTDRSYLFGRLLAVMEQVERSTYDNNESRETNAIRMQSVFAQRPLYGWRIIEEKLTPYFTRLTPGSRAYFKGIIGEIADKLPDASDPELGKKLSDSYLLGYYHQRTAMTQKKDKGNGEDVNNGSAE